MRFKKWVIVLALLTCGTMGFAHQNAAFSWTKPQSEQRAPVQVEFISPEELKAKIARNEPIAIADLRGPSSYAQSDSIIKGSVHAKFRNIAHRLREVPRDREVITYCACSADEAAILAARELLASGFKRVRVLKGGWTAWLQAGGQVQPKR